MPGEDGLGGHDWLPRRRFVLELARQGVENPYVEACRRFEEKDSRRREILRNRFSNAAKAVLRAEQEYARAIRVAEGGDRTPRERAFESETEEMREAEEKLPELSAKLQAARERLEELEAKHRGLVRWIERNFIPAAARDVEIPSLPDMGEEIARHGSRPGPSALDRTAVRMGV